MKTVGMLLLLAALAVAQDAKPAASPKLDGKEAEQAAQMKILKAKVALKTAQSELDQLQIQFASNKQRYDEAQAQIQQQAPQKQQAVQLKQQILKSEEDAACKELGMDPAKSKFDEDNLTCSPVPETKDAKPETKPANK